MKLMNASIGRLRYAPADKSLLGFLVCTLCLCLLLALCVGPAGTESPAKLITAFFAPAGDMHRMILLEIRLPRALLAMLVGAALGASGAVMQGLMRNPLADPGLIGISSGAALAAAIIIVLGDGVLAPLLSPFGIWAVPAGGLAGGLAAVLLLYAFSTRAGVTSIATVLLGGIAIAAFAGALTGILITMANDKALRDISFWSLGSLSGASWSSLTAVAPFMLCGFACLLFLPNGLNAMLLGEAEAYHLGAKVQQLKRLSLFAVACLTGAAVSITGVIGFIGLLVPHLVRLTGGADNRLVLPGSALLGASLLVLADMLARSLAAPAELPVGVVTAAIGAPCFFWLLLRQHNRLG